MPPFVIFLFICTFLSHLSLSAGCKGCVNLDEKNFDKIIPKFKLAIVKFDVAYPYGEKHEAFTKIAEELADNENVIVGEVAFKDYGDKENEGLIKTYEVNSKELPVVKLFVNGNVKDASTYLAKEKWDSDSLRDFVKGNGVVYIALPGCFEKLDKAAAEFIKSSDKEKKYSDIVKTVDSLTDPEKEAAKVYLKYMSKIKTEGVKFVDHETKRLTKLLAESKILEKKKLDLSKRLNVLKSFSVPTKKDEL